MEKYINHLILLTKEVILMKWKKIDGNKWEDTFSKRYDFIVTKERRKFILDIFNKRIKNISEAYINSFELSSLKEAKQDAENYL